MQRPWVVSPHYKAVVETLKAARAEKGLSLREVGRRMGKPPSFPNKIELLERRIDILEFIVLARAYEIDPHELLDRLIAVVPDKPEF
jgi:transcriptional regulator with XRE-family HTH domain